MFEINLIKDRIIPTRLKRLAFILVGVYALLWVVTLMTVAFLYVTDARTIGTYRQDTANVERDIGMEVPRVPTRKELVLLRDRLLPRLASIRSVVRARVRWSPKIGEISAHMPEGVRLSRLYMEESEEGARTLILEGRLSGKAPDEDQAVALLVSRLSESSTFMEGVREIVPSVEGTSFQIACPLAEGKGM